MKRGDWFLTLLDESRDLGSLGSFSSCTLSWKDPQIPAGPASGGEEEGREAHLPLDALLLIWSRKSL